jgi:prepilin-type N-terminal cleavage/methylation domain-containing protein
MTRKSSSRGMTMVEIMMVIGIIGVLTALAVPELLRLTRSSRVVGDARSVSDLISGMRAQAMTRGFPMVACLRGRTWAGPEGLARQVFTFRKGLPLPPALCTGAVCPPTVVDPLVPDYTPAAAPPDTRSVDLLLEGDDSNRPTVSWTLPTADNRTFQLVFDMDGNVTGWESDNCAGAAHTAVAAAPLAAPATGNGWTLSLWSPADPTIIQVVAVRTDGRVILP